jgi:hypothetical protein
VYPTNHKRTEIPSNAQRVFNTLFQGCAADTTCNTNYPNLQSTFYSLVDSLNATPIAFSATDPTTGTAHSIPAFYGDDLVSWLFSSLYATSIIPTLPKVIYEVKNKNYTTLAYYYGYLFFDNSFSDGLFYSTECSEDWPYSTQADITASTQGIESHIAKVFGGGLQVEYAVCQFWKVDKLPATQKDPVTSSIHTLITEDEYDPITPPADGQDAASHLTNSYFVQFPGQGHGAEYSSPCSNTVISAFEDNPTTKPDTSCVSSMTEPAFS